MESRGCSVLELGALAAEGQRRLHVSCHGKRGAARGGSRHGLFILKGKTTEQGIEVHGASMPAWAEDGGLDSGGERGQTPICVSVVWKSRSHQLRRRGGEANWEVVGAASSLQSAARLLKSRRASRYLVPPDAPTEGHEGHEGGMEVEEGGGWVSPSGVCVRVGPEVLVATYRGKLPAAVRGLLPNSVPTRWQRAGMRWKKIPRKKKVGDGEGGKRGPVEKRLRRVKILLAVTYRYGTESTPYMLSLWSGRSRFFSRPLTTRGSGGHGGSLLVPQSSPPSSATLHFTAVLFEHHPSLAWSGARYTRSPRALTSRPV